MEHPGETIFVDSDQPEAMLSPAELRILKLYATGRSCIEVARLLNRSEKTISTHVSRIALKLGLENNRQVHCVAAAWFANVVVRDASSRLRGASR
jgi:DNA-binding NarL/FixJ family response regulator